jgi:putative ATP-binding cassette transporter
MTKHSPPTTFFDLVKRESEGMRRRIIITTAVSGLASAAILAVINQAAQTASHDTWNVRYFLMFVVAMTLYILCLRYSSREMNRVMIDVVHRIRLRIVNKVQRAELSILEGIDKSEILNAITMEATIIADSGEMMTAGLQASVLVFFAALYVAYLSIPAFLLTLLTASAGVVIVNQGRARSRHWMHSTKNKEVDFLNYVTHAIDGFKETKLNRKRMDDLGRDLHDCSDEITDLRMKTYDLLNRNTILAQSSFYVLIGVVVFILPPMIETYTGVIIQITTAILFIVSPLRLIVGQVPDYTKCDEATQAILRLEHALDRRRATDGTTAAARPKLDRSFTSIVLDDVRFAYRNNGDELFGLGPVSMTVNAGEIVFLVGGNGSGKSTLLKLIAGLYPPDSGTIRVDGTDVATVDGQSYRELFSAILADFHLFERLYGLLGTREQVVEQLLKEMQLDRKVGFVEDHFTTFDLSTGQRKRLALIVSMLDRKPVFLFDELAADQDPEFRKFLYEELLPKLKRQGQTVFAATHDDRFFYIADKVIKLEYGEVTNVQPERTT